MREARVLQLEIVPLAEIIPRGMILKDRTLKKTESCNSPFVHVTHGRGSSLASRDCLKSLLNARLCRLTETARLLKNVKSVFTRRSNAASRVNVEVELSRKLSLPQTFAHRRNNYPFTGPHPVPSPNRSNGIDCSHVCKFYDPRETSFLLG